ncbi:MAG: class II aldolase/adducin family protein [Bdellovibrionaceae bacterium]|nr:class II aldolase/adducin family protein [Pseudobdellovibrionaceae bacterium]
MKSKIPLICKKLYEKKLIVGCDGNVSEKKGDKIIITPSNVNKSEIRSQDLCLINQKGENLKGQASSEKHMHLAIYKYQKKAQAIVHAHPPSAIALSLVKTQWKFLPQALPEMIIALGPVPFASYIQPGTKKLGNSLKHLVQKSKAVILSHHGAVVWAENLEKAFLIMEQLEHSCKILCLSEAMGTTKTLSQKEIKKLLTNYEF